ncbi:MAG TPA: Mur ligase family protein [Polyangia bacterium]|jgi:dihydrofolate synthase/folylpolyglutamate synthase|nr:Mur ligase family protein [Polyangia bacterium]
MRSALRRLGSPERRFAAIQIAGTNGKGSTAAITESILRAAGFKTGLFTSPHLSRFTERIRIAGGECDGERLAEIDRLVVATGVPLTYFEVATALAFVLMAEEQVDVAVLETGLGGRLDAVTTCRPLATAITSIGLDHTDYLGTTLREIAAEKAGIIKPGVPLYLGNLPAVAEEEILRIAQAAGAPVFRLGRGFSPLAAAAHSLALTGSHQRDNGAIAVALATAAADALALATRRTPALTAAAVTAGLGGVVWPGRLERIGDDVLLDCAHNPEGAVALAAALREMQQPRGALVLSVVTGKDLTGILEPLLPLFNVVVATASRNPRAMPADALAEGIRAFRPAPPDLEVVTATDSSEAVSIVAARRLLPQRQRGSAPAGTPLIVFAGSVFLVGEARALLLGEAGDPQPVSDPV